MTPTTEMTVVAPISSAVHWKETKDKHGTLLLVIIIYSFILIHLLSRGSTLRGERFLKAREDNQSENIRGGVNSVTPVDTNIQLHMLVLSKELVTF